MKIIIILIDTHHPCLLVLYNRTNALEPIAQPASKLSSGTRRHTFTHAHKFIECVAAIPAAAASASHFFLLLYFFSIRKPKTKKFQTFFQRHMFFTDIRFCGTVYVFLFLFYLCTLLLKNMAPQYVMFDDEMDIR